MSHDMIAWPFNVVRQANFGWYCIINPTLLVLRKHLVIGQLSFSLFFIGPYMGSFTVTD